MITKNEFRDAVIEGIKRVKGVEHVDLANDENFSSAGLDSLDAMDLVLQVEAITGLNFGELNAAEANTVDAFYRKAEALFGDPTSST
jgi:acyl carrier protein